MDQETLRVEIRPAAVADAEAIINLHFAAVHQTASGFYPPEILDAWSRQPDERRYEQVRRAIAKREEVVVVAQDASGVVGFGSILPDVQELHALYVHPRVGRVGIGSRILNHLERLALDRGAQELRLDASVNAEAFYRRAGYEVEERGVFRLQSGHEMASVRMKKQLGPAPEEAPDRHPTGLSV